MKKTEKNKKILIICVAIVSLLIIGAVIIQIFTPGIIWFFTPKARAKDGVLESIGETDHISDVPQGEIKYLINNNVLLKNNGSKGDFMFENPEACEYTIQFSVYQVVGENGEENIIYTSPMIAPGQFMINDKLDKKLPAGEYACVYFARAYLDGEYIGERSGDMTVTVAE